MGKKGHKRSNCWHWNKNQSKGKYEKNDSKKNTAIIVIAKDIMVLSIEEQKCEHVVNNNIVWVGLATSHHVIPTKWLFTVCKARDFGSVKMGNSIQKLWKLVMCAYPNQCW